MSVPDRAETIRAVYDHSVDLFLEVIGATINPDFETEADRALLDEFAERVVAAPGGPALDIGCGPGRVAARLAELGLDAAGCDISPAMIDAARLEHPHLSFEVAPLDDLPVDDGTLAGAVFWYSIINTPPDELGRIWVELDRALAPDGCVLVAFQAGDNDRVDRPDAYGSGTTLTLYRHAVGDVATTLRAVGFEVDGEVCRRAEQPGETSPQAFLTAHRR